MHVQYGNITATTIAIVIGFIAIPSIFAQTTPLATSSRSSTNGTLDTILGAPFFEDRGSKVTGTRVINTNPVQTEDPFVANLFGPICRIYNHYITYDTFYYNDGNN
jgi:hypothetical protein